MVIENIPKGTGAMVGSAFGPIGTGIGAAADFGIDYFSKKKGAKSERRKREKEIAEQQAYANFLRDLGAQYEGKLGKQFEVGEGQFLQETGQALPELQQAAESIRAGATESQESARRKMEADLTRGGVRGGQAATLQARGIGQMGTDLERLITQMSLKEAETRRTYRAPYFGEKAMYPYKQRASALGAGQRGAQQAYMNAAPALFQTA